MPRPIYTPPYRPFLWTPDGWDAVWKAGKAGSGSAPAHIMSIGDSVAAGYGNSSYLKTFPNLIQAKMAAILGGTWGDFWSMMESPVWSCPSDEPWGLGLNSYFPTGSAGLAQWLGFMRLMYSGITTSLPGIQFTFPYAASSADLIWTDSYPGSWQYKLGAAANVTITNTTLGSGSTGDTQVKRATVGSSIANGTAFQVGWQSTSAAMMVHGIATYTGQAGGLAVSRIHANGASIIEIGNGGGQPPEPANRCLLYAGINPMISDPPIATPSGSLTLGAASAGALTGTFWWKFTLIGNGGETAISSGAPVTATLSAQQQALTTPAWPGTGGAFATNIYRGTSSTGPWVKVGQVTTSGASFTDNNASPSGSPPASSPSYVFSPGFGFPFTNPAPHLVIMSLGLNDAGQGQPSSSVHQVLSRLLYSLRRARDNVSILLVIPSMPVAPYADMTPQAGFTNGDNYYAYIQEIYHVASEFNCAVLNVHAKWGDTPFGKGFMPNNNVHPTDAGHADIASAILSAL